MPNLQFGEFLLSFVIFLNIIDDLLGLDLVFEKLADLLEPSLFFVRTLVPFVSGKLRGRAPLIKPLPECFANAPEELFVPYVQLALGLDSKIQGSLLVIKS